jgi:hypothetical protein
MLLDPENTWHIYMLTCEACIVLHPLHVKQGISAIWVFGHPRFEVYLLADSLYLPFNLWRVYLALKWTQYLDKCLLQVANYCADRLHHTLAEETLSSFANEGGADNGARNWENRWKKAMTSCFLRMDAEVGGVSGRDCDCGQAEGCAKCSIDPIAPETVGTTAIVAVVGSCQIIVGNCGDSRAVLSRGGVAVPLSVDHKVCCFLGFETCA